MISLSVVQHIDTKQLKKRTASCGSRSIGCHSSWQGRDGEGADTLHLQTEWRLASISSYSLFIFIQSRTSAHFQDGSSLLCSTSAPKTPSRAYSEMGVLGDSKSRWVGSEDVPSEFFYQKRKFS